VSGEGFVVEARADVEEDEERWAVLDEEMVVLISLTSFGSFGSDFDCASRPLAS